MTNTITYSGLRDLTVNGSSNYTVTNTSITTSTVLNAGVTDDTITVTNASGPLAINAGDGNDTITVSGAGVGGNVTVSGGNGNDAITLGSAANKGLTLINCPIFVDGGAGTDTLTFSDAAWPNGDTYTVKSGSLEIPSIPGFAATHANFENIILNVSKGGDNTITVMRTPPAPKPRSTAEVMGLTRSTSRERPAG